jgi:CheY-like chemotaxis protein
MENHAPILVAEDEETDAMLLRLAARQAGISQPIVVMPDGSELVDYLQGVDPCVDRSRHPLPILILLDLKMPRMTGFEVLSWLATRPDLKHVPVVVLSSSSQEEDIARARQLGASDYYVKPHHLADLINILKTLDSRWLSKHPVPSP